MMFSPFSDCNSIRSNYYWIFSTVVVSALSLFTVTDGSMTGSNAVTPHNYVAMGPPGLGQ